MAIRIACPSCDASLSFDDAKRGKKVTCKKCEETFTVPSANAKAKTSESAIQDGRKVKAKASSKSDDDDERPAKKKKAEPKKSGGMGLILVLGSIAAVLLVGCVGAAGIGAFFFLKARPTADERIALEKDALAKKIDLEAKKDGEPKKEPEPKKDGEPKNDIEPKKDALKKDPNPKVDPVPKTGPPTLSAELQRVKQATVFVSALLPTGLRSEGSGFLTVEPGLVVTNAHVIGMQDPMAQMPNSIDVILYPGEANETKVAGALIGVDRTADLAVLRVAGFQLPTPLGLEDSAKVNATQAVQIASHPLDGNKRKAFSLTPTMVTGVSRVPGGKADAVLVGDGISRASSGGPVVSTAGMVVGIAGNDNQARKATSSDLIKRFLDGGISEGTVGKVVGTGSSAKVPVDYPLIDPLQRVKEARIEVWSGPVGAKRPGSATQPAPLPGDGARKSQSLVLKKGSTGGDAFLPASMPPGQVVWLQPVIVLKDNTMRWGVATSISAPPPSPYEQRPANLTVKLFSPKDRTVNLKATFKSANTETRITASILEQMGNGPTGYAEMKNGFGIFSSTQGQNQPVPKATLDLVRPLAPTYIVDPTNRIVNRTFPTLDQKLPPETRDPAVILQYQIATAYETNFLTMPNRAGVKPGESWQAAASVAIRTKAKVKAPTALLDLNATYEGFLTRNNRTEAIITVNGKLSALASRDLKKYEGTVSGTLGFDESAGYISSAQLKITGNAADSVSLDIDMTRTTGNAAGIQLAQDTKQPNPNPKDPKDKTPKTLFDQKGAMIAGGNFDPQFTDLKKKRVAYKQDIPLKLEMGKNYTFHVTNAAFDSYMKLYAPTGIVAQGGGAGNTSKITYRAPATGVFTLSVISHNGKTGGYHLKVQEAP